MSVLWFDRSDDCGANDLIVRRIAEVRSSIAVLDAQVAKYRDDMTPATTLLIRATVADLSRAIATIAAAVRA